ncbi:hypothetical protein HanIR_Chr13g0661421 [Helianthus annuus]|nr:hypothetical protein HanIR_Chr13g0661421 [Helianthus annuus]
MSGTIFIKNSPTHFSPNKVIISKPIVRCDPSFHKTSSNCRLPILHILVKNHNFFGPLVGILDQIFIL